MKSKIRLFLATSLVAGIGLFHANIGKAIFFNSVILSGFPVPPAVYHRDDYFNENMMMWKIKNAGELAQVRASIQHMIPVRVDVICGLMLSELFDEKSPKRLDNYERYRTLYMKMPELLGMSRKHFYEGSHETVATDTDVEECLVKFTHYRIKTLIEILEKEE